MKQQSYQIVIVEDDHGLQKLINKKLSIEGFDTLVFEDGEALKNGIDKISQKAIILLDYKLPDSNGIDLAEQLNFEERGLPFIIMTGHGDEKIAVEMMKLGAKDYLVKESNFIELLIPVINQTVRELMLEEKLTHAVTDNREKNSIMMLQSRQAFMGEMISNIAIHWQNVINVISSETKAIKEESTNKVVETTIEKINLTIKNLKQHIENLQSFFAPDKEKAIFYFDSIIKRATALMESTFAKYKIKFESKLVEHIEITGYETDYIQVILNILNNCKDAHIQNNTPNPFIKIGLNQIKEFNLLTITDNAGGIDDNLINKIFDPYFTTKTTGSGLGLYISKNFVEKEMKGNISARNIDNGVEIRIEIPR